jgi:hypothetical protein
MITDKNDSYNHIIISNASHNYIMIDEICYNYIFSKIKVIKITRE